MPAPGRASGDRQPSVLAPFAGRSVFLTVLALAQTIVAVRVLGRLVRTAGGERIAAVDQAPGPAGAVTAVVPVLNECARLGPCLDGLLAQGPELGEILIVDGGSVDCTRDLVEAYRVRDDRLRLLDGSLVPDGWNGKAWALELGAREATRSAGWLLTMDADVRPKPGLVAALLAHAARQELGVLSVATAQELADAGSGLMHPALLATLVYRFGIPGHADRRVSAVQANGQCLLICREILAEVGGFGPVRASLCDDVTLAREAAARGHLVGFYETAGLVSARMYESGREAFDNWTRSLPLRDHLVNRRALLGLVEVALVQALPLPLVLLLALGRRRADRHFGHRASMTLNLILLAARLGVLVGTARAYRRPPYTYWLSPLFDLPVVVQLWRSTLAREHRWRGRILVSREAA